MTLWHRSSRISRIQMLYLLLLFASSGQVSIIGGRFSFFSWMRDYGIKHYCQRPSWALVGFCSSSLCRCVSAGGQVSVQWEHPWRHPHGDSRSAGRHKKYRELRHTGVVLKLDNNSGMGRCWLGGRLGGLGGVGPSARGNTIPGEGGGTEVPFALIFHLTTFLLGQTELHATIPTFCSWWGRRVHRWAKRTTFYRKEKNIFAWVDNQGVVKNIIVSYQEMIREFLNIGRWQLIPVSGEFCFTPCKW